MIGAKRYIQTHPNKANIIAEISMDTLGRYYYDGMNVSLVGQYQSYRPIWLALATREAARAGRANGITWDVNLPAPSTRSPTRPRPSPPRTRGRALPRVSHRLGLGACSRCLRDEHIVSGTTRTTRWSARRWRLPWARPA
jgi:hypothetical protein